MGVLWRGRAGHAESPIWLGAHGGVLFVDAANARLIFAATETDALPSKVFRLKEHWYWIAWLASKQCYFAGREKDIISFQFDPVHGPSRVEPIFVLPSHPEGCRFNDAKVVGRDWIITGTMDMAGRANTGALYRIGSQGDVAQIDDDYVIANGPCVSPEGDRLYMACSARRVLYVYNLSDTCEVSARRTFFEVPSSLGAPDGLTCDRLGGVWMAHWDGGGVSRVRPDGIYDRFISLPVRGTTSLTFYGAALDSLAVTTSWKVQRLHPASGHLFSLGKDVLGLG